MGKERIAVLVSFKVVVTGREFWDSEADPSDPARFFFRKRQLHQFIGRLTTGRT